MKVRGMEVERSLVVNGKFAEHYSTGWAIHIGTVTQESAEGVDYLYLYDGIIKQRFALPVDPHLSTYTLSVDYQPSQSPADPPVHPYVELRAFPSDVYEKVNLIGPSKEKSNGMPWLKREENFSRFSTHDAFFELRFASGCNGGPTPDKAPGDWPWLTGAMHFTNVSVKLHLNPLVLEDIVVTLDGCQPRFFPGGKVPICRGAKHRLQVVASAECGWGGDELFPGTLVYADWQDPAQAHKLDVKLLLTEPEQDGTQLFNKPLELVCGNQGNADLPIIFNSIYNAAPFTLRCVVGHFRVEQVGCAQPEYWPVFPEGEGIELAVCLRSLVVDGPADGVAVSWAKADGNHEVVVTDMDGWARYNYVPVKAEDHVVTAICDAPYNAEVMQQVFNIRTLPTAPWEQFDLLFDGKLMDMSKGFLLLTLGKTHLLQLKPSAACVLKGEQIELQWELQGGAPDEVRVNPALGASAELSDDGLSWQIECLANFERRIAISLHCRRLSQPLEFAVMLLGIGRMAIASAQQQEEALADPDKIKEYQLYYVA